MKETKNIVNVVNQKKNKFLLFFCFFDQITIVFFILSSFLCALTGRSGGCDCKLLNVQEGGVCNFSLVFPLYPSLTVLNGKNRLTFLLKII